VTDVDPRLVTALLEQLARRRADAVRVGWKFGSGEGERIGGEIAVGQLTSKTVLEDGATYSGGGDDLHADVELAVELGDRGAISRYGVALEICDLADGNTPEEVVAHNDYHRAVAFGALVEVRPEDLHGTLFVNGERCSSARAPDDVRQRIAAVERVLVAVGERLQPGDRLITGLIVNGAVRAGDEVVAELGALGSVRLAIA
jgi:hypothetical protein